MTATLSPCSAKRRAQARPIPREPPVTRTDAAHGATPPQRSTALAAVMPAPKPTSRTRSPSLMRPSSSASTSASGIDADEVLPVVCSTVAVRSHGDAEALARGVDDPDVGLVGDDERDVVGGDAGVGHGLLAGVHHDAHRPPEHLAPVHVEVPADLGVQEALGRAVGVEVPAQELARTVDLLQHHRARAVGEQDGRAPVAPSR